MFILNLIYSQNYYSLKHIPLLYYRGQQNTSIFALSSASYLFFYKTAKQYSNMTGEERKGKALLLPYTFEFSPPTLQSLQTDSRVWSVFDLTLSQGKAQGGLMYSRNLCLRSYQVSG